MFKIRKLKSNKIYLFIVDVHHHSLHYYYDLICCHIFDVNDLANDFVCAVAVDNVDRYDAMMNDYCHVDILNLDHHHQRWQPTTVTTAKVERSS